MQYCYCCITSHHKISLKHFLLLMVCASAGNPSGLPLADSCDLDQLWVGCAAPLILAGLP